MVHINSRPSAGFLLGDMIVARYDIVANGNPFEDQFPGITSPGGGDGSGGGGGRRDAACVQEAGREGEEHMDWL